MPAVGPTCLRACQITVGAAWLPGQRRDMRLSSRVWRRKSVDLPRTGLSDYVPLLGPRAKLGADVGFER